MRYWQKIGATFGFRFQFPVIVQFTTSVFSLLTKANLPEEENVWI